jgi:hypothetical protein
LVYVLLVGWFLLIFPLSFSPSVLSAFFPAVSSSNFLQGSLMNDLSTDSAVDDLCLSALPKETHGLAPHPDNHRLARDTVAHMLYRIGIELPNLGVGADAGFAAAWIARYFTTRVGDALTSMVVDHMSTLPAIDAAEHAMFLRDTTPPDPLVGSGTVWVNLLALQRLLNLTDFERGMLQWAYALVGVHDTLPSRVLSHLMFEDDDHRYRMMATLFDVPIQTVQSYFLPTSVNRLVALGLLSPNESQIGQCLADLLAATDLLTRVLETPCRSDAMRLALLLEHEEDDALLTDDDDSRAPLYETYPSQIADCYERTLRNQTLRVQDVRALVEWFTGSEFKREWFEWFDSSGGSGGFDKCFGFVTVRETIKRCAIERCRAGLQLRPSDVLRALLVAATPALEASVKRYQVTS